MTTEPTTLTRTELYELLWATPMIRLAGRFGLSDNGLRKICRRLDVPCPPAGWWARTAAGKKVRPIPLPAAKPGLPESATIAPTPAATDDLRDAVRQEAQRIGPIDVPERLVKPHPVIARWISDHRSRQEDARRHRREWPGATWRLPDLTPGERRRHRILNALFRALERHGAVISENDRRHLFVDVCDEPIEFGCHEKSKQTFRPLTKDEKRWRSNKDARVQELQPTGRLEFGIRAWLDQSFRKTWLETETKPIEGMLPEIAATFLVLGPLLAERSRQRAEEHRQREERQRAAEVERQRRQQDDNRWKRFLQIAEGWKKAELAREFIARLKQRDRPDAEPVDGRSVTEWIAWAEAKASEFDPLEQSIDRIFADVARVTAWTQLD